MYYVEFVNEFTIFDEIADEYEISREPYVKDNLSEIVDVINEKLNSTFLYEDETMQLFLVASNDNLPVIFETITIDRICDLVSKLLPEYNEVTINVLKEWEDTYDGEDGEQYTESSRSYMFHALIKNEKSYAESIL